MSMLMKPNASYTPTPIGAYVSKVEKYKWKNPGEPGEFLWISKDDLKIDEEQYQRESKSTAKVRDIARNWDWKLIGCISVAMRKDGSMMVVDGGHRKRAADLRSDITDLPCMVFEVESIAEEAKTFYGTNTMQSAVSAFHKWRAACIAGDPDNLHAKRILEMSGILAEEGMKTKFAGIGTLVWLVKNYKDIADQVFDVAMWAAGDDKIPTANMIRGICYLMRNDVVLGKVIGDRLSQYGTQVIVSAMSKESIMQNAGGERVYAKAMVDLMNKGRRKKIHMPG